MRRTSGPPHRLPPPLVSRAAQPRLHGKGRNPRPDVDPGEVRRARVAYRGAGDSARSRSPPGAGGADHIDGGRVPGRQRRARARTEGEAPTASEAAIARDQERLCGNGRQSLPRNHPALHRSAGGVFSIDPYPRHTLRASPGQGRRPQPGERTRLHRRAPAAVGAPTEAELVALRHVRDAVERHENHGRDARPHDRRRAAGVFQGVCHGHAPCGRAGSPRLGFRTGPRSSARRSGRTRRSSHTERCCRSRTGQYPPRPRSEPRSSCVTPCGSWSSGSSTTRARVAPPGTWSSRTVSNRSRPPARRSCRSTCA